MSAEMLRNYQGSGLGNFRKFDFSNNYILNVKNKKNKQS